MTTKAKPPKLHWPVPMRRAVVRGRLSYSDLVQAWIGEVDAHSAELCRWYEGLDTAGLARAIASLRTWHGRFFAVEEEGEDVARDEANLLDTPPPFFVRLWKGPLRVLVEPERFDATGKPHAKLPGPLVAAVKKGEALRLEASERGEVRNNDADFVMGDLVEFPVFTLLRLAGVSAYADCRFSGEGSPFLGTSVEGAGGEGQPELHENMLAMRFQLLLGLGRGAFSSEGDPLFNSGKPRDLRPHAFGDGYEVWARGMIYAGTLAYKPKKTKATVENYHWGAERKASDVPQCVTAKSGIDNLSTTHPVTPGWTCSPATLMLTNFMMLIGEGQKRGGGSVRKTMTKKKYEGAPIRSLYESTTPEQLLEDSREQIDRVRTRIETLQKEISEIVPLLAGEQALSAVALAQAATSARWGTDVPEKTRKLLERRAKNPQAFYDTLRKRLKQRRVTEEEAAALEALRIDLIDRGVSVRERIETLVASEAWKAIPIKPNVIRVRNRLPVRSELEREQARDSRRVPRLIFHEAVKTQLLDKRKALAKTADGPLAGLKAIAVDLSDVCSEFSVVSLDGHEWALVRVKPAEKLLEAGSLPRVGFITAYDPLSGEPAYIGPTEQERGQLHVFEATGSLRRWTHDGTTYNTYGAKPFKWVPLDANLVAIGPRNEGGLFIRQKVRYRKKEGSVHRDDSAGTGSWKKFLHIWSFTAEGLARIEQEYASRTSWEPLVITPTRKDEGAKACTTRITKNFELFYRERAVPFPTIAETEGGFVSHDEMKRAMKRMADLAEPNFEGSEKCQLLWQTLTGKDRPDPKPQPVPASSSNESPWGSLSSGGAEICPLEE